MSPSPLRTVIRNFTSQWFLIPQGTGILSVILHQLDYQFHGLPIISVILWFITFITLGLFLAIYFIRIVLYPKEVFNAITHTTVEAACLSSISIAFTSTIQMLSIVVVQSWGGRTWGMVAYVLWWINTALAVAACFCLPVIFINSIQAEGGLQRAFTPATQLPLIAALTSAAGAGTLCQYALLDPRQQVPMIIVGFAEIGVGIPLALALDTLFWTRQFFPWETSDNLSLPRSKVYTEMILCGPWGQGSFAMQTLGRAVLGAFAGYDGSGGMLLTKEASTPIGYGSILFGLLSWAASSFWWFFAVLGIVSAWLRRTDGVGIPFGMSTWSIIFPWGVYTNATVQLGKLMDSPVFQIWSTILAVALVLLWLTCSAFTIKGAIDGRIFGLEYGWKLRRDASD